MNEYNLHFVEVYFVYVVLYVVFKLVRHLQLNSIQIRHKWCCDVIISLIFII